MPDNVYDILAPALKEYIAGIESYPLQNEEETKQMSYEETVLLSKNIRSVGLSIRALNAFMCVDVDNLDDAINLGRDAYKHLRNVGKLTMREVDLKMFDLGLYEKWKGVGK